MFWLYLTLKSRRENSWKFIKIRETRVKGPLQEVFSCLHNVLFSISLFTAFQFPTKTGPFVVWKFKIGSFLSEVDFLF